METSISPSISNTLGPRYLLGLDEDMIEYVICLEPTPMLIKIHDGPEAEETIEETITANSSYNEKDDEDDDEDAELLQTHFLVEPFWITPTGTKPMGTEKGTEVVKNAIAAAIEFYIDQQSDME